MALTEKQQAYIVRHFKNTKNDILMQKLGISHSALHRFAQEQGLKKTKQFQAKCQLEASQKAREVNSRNGWPPKGHKIPRSEEFGFKPGVTPEQRLGKKKNAERIRKSAESRRKTFAAENRRVLFGLPQQTKLKVVRAHHNKASYRHTLKKRGYIVARAAKEILYDHCTNRSERVERSGYEKYRFHFKPLEMVG
jgi:hypothetical protein